MLIHRSKRLRGRLEISLSSRMHALASLVCIIFGALQLWWIITWLQYFFGVLYLRCVTYLVLCICTFGMLSIGIFGAITIVQCIFGALFRGLGCNTFLVLRLWCYALSAILRRLATAVAHLLYLFNILLRNLYKTLHFWKWEVSYMSDRTHWWWVYFHPLYIFWSMLLLYWWMH